MGIVDDTLPERTVRVHPTDKPWMTLAFRKKPKLDNVPTQMEIMTSVSYSITKCQNIKRGEKKLTTDLRLKVFATSTQRNGVG